MTSVKYPSQSSEPIFRNLAEFWAAATIEGPAAKVEPLASKGEPSPPVGERPAPTAESETEASPAPFRLVRPGLVEAAVREPLWFCPPSLVAHRGSLEFARDSELERESLGLFLYKALLGERSCFALAGGEGELYLGRGQERVFLLYLAEETLWVQGYSILAFQRILNHRVQLMGQVGGLVAGGLYAVRLEGRGWVALSVSGEVAALRSTPAKPLRAVPIHLLAWSQALEPHLQTEHSLFNMVVKGCGDGAQFTFQGEGWVALHGEENYMYPQVR